jgi:hypothetical protein
MANFFEVSTSSLALVPIAVAVAASCMHFLLQFVSSTRRKSRKTNPKRELQSTPPRVVADAPTKKKRKGACPFSSDSKFLVESDMDIPPAPLDLLESWSDPAHTDFGKPLAARWLDAGLSGQDTPGILRAGLKPLRDSKYFLLEEACTIREELLMKEKALNDPARHPSLFVAEDDDECLNAQNEVLELFLEYLPMRYPSEYQYDPVAKVLRVNALDSTFRVGVDYADRPLELCERIVQEDLILMRTARDGDVGLDGRPTSQYVMSAAAVVFSFGELEEKLGKPMEFIHAPVPGYPKDLKKTLDLTFAKLLKVPNPLWRNNWGISPSGALDNPLYGSTGATRRRSMMQVPTIEEIKSKFLKVEYQTIRRLPTSGYLLFTVRTMADPMSSLAGLPKAASCLAKSIRGMSTGMRAYKGIANDDVCSVVLEYLDGIGAGDDGDEPKIGQK